MSESWPVAACGMTAYLCAFVLPSVGILPPVHETVLRPMLGDMLVTVGAVIKAMPVALLALDAWTISTRVMASAPDASGIVHANYAMFMAYGLALGALGDFFMDLSADIKSYFTVGLVSFLMGHIWYIAALWQQAPGEPRSHSLPAAALVGVFVSGLLYILLPSVDADMLVPVIVYACVIGCMSYCALVRRTDRPRVYATAALGALVFMLSDAILAVDEFYMKGKLPLAKLLVMLTYYSAQLLIAGSVGAVEGRGARGQRHGGQGHEGKGREGKGREGKGREGKEQTAAARASVPGDDAHTGGRSGKAGAPAASKDAAPASGGTPNTSSSSARKRR